MYIFEQFSPKEIKSCCLIEKIGNNFDIDWFGFKISSNFIYGYGMDYKLLHRNLNSIYEIDINEG